MLPAVGQAPGIGDAVEARFAQFSADCQPKAHRLQRHVFFDVTSQPTHVQYVEDRDDPAKPDLRVVASSTAYMGDATRFVRTTDFLHGATGITILRPDVNYSLFKENGGSLRVTYQWRSPEDVWKECFTRPRHQYDRREFEALGIGLMYRDEALLTVMTKESVVITDVQFRKDGALDAATIHFHFPPNPDRYEFSFHTDIGVSYRQVLRMPRGVNVAVVEYECPGRVVENFVPKRRASTGVSLVRPLAPKLTDEYVVEEFRKQSHFEDAVFGLAQYRLPDFAPTPPSSCRGGVLLALVGVFGLVTLLGLWRLGRRRTARP